jgi:hypothetical protein
MQTRKAVDGVQKAEWSNMVRLVVYVQLRNAFNDMQQARVATML